MDPNQTTKHGAGQLLGTADDPDLNAVAAEGLAALRRMVNENDLNDLVADWLNFGQPSSDVGVTTKFKRNFFTDAIKSLIGGVSTGIHPTVKGRADPRKESVSDLAKAGVKAMLALARGVDYNSLANKGLDYLSSAMEKTDLNEAASSGTKVANETASDTDVNSLEDKGTDRLSGRALFVAA